MSATPKIVAFCTPQADVLVALDSDGQLWQRDRDQRQVSGPYGRPAYTWVKIAGPRDEHDPVIEAQVDKFREALMAARKP